DDAQLLPVLAQAGLGGGAAEPVPGVHRPVQPVPGHPPPRLEGRQGPAVGLALGGRPRTRLQSVTWRWIMRGSLRPVCPDPGPGARSGANCRRILSRIAFGIAHRGAAAGPPSPGLWATPDLSRCVCPAFAKLPARACRPAT